MTTLTDIAGRVERWVRGRTGYDLPVLAEPGLTAAHVRAPTPIEPVLYSPIYCLVLQGRKSVHFGGRTISFRPGEGVIVSHHLPALGRIERASAAEPYVALALRIDVVLLRSLPRGAAGMGRVESILSAHAAPPLLEAMARLMALTDEPESLPVLAPLLNREIHYRLLQSEHGGMLRRLAEADSHASRIARAIGHIRRSFAEPLSVSDLARVAGMSQSSFHEHFRAITATTPLQFQKQLRLTEARRLLLGGSLNVGGVARTVGYESPTQFSREYARAFGRPPRGDRQKAA